MRSTNHSAGTERQRKAFTLIELLVVISIIAILASLLLPALGKAKERSKAVLCLGNLKQCGVAVLTYAGDNDESLPPSYTSPWSNPWFPMYIESYLGGKLTYPSHPGSVLTCPSETSHHPNLADYGCNYSHVTKPTATNVKLSRFTRSSALILMVDAWETGNKCGGWYTACPICSPGSACVPWPRHNNGMNLLYLDSHTGWVIRQACTANQDDMWGHTTL
ncbi:MAG: hypothetical protein A3K19_15585 [Lentisphaerae bacterium RIFOXYB12_FULL_65_16]|nr:MAG: hypothetical protein A3K18_11600 [Lentisphaerae bacterium RIFOXYA12_64_32]OGV88523.1 MAG: hypothetical protein A3K19_15585 [Lentisphaerae bacterium RIFOXYB12_FULL_65_16]